MTSSVLAMVDRVRLRVHLTVTFFKLFALDAKLDLKPGSARTDLERAMKGQVSGEAQVMGKDGR